MNVKVQISNTQLFGLVLSLLLVAAVSYVQSYGGTQPAVAGHSAGEIDFSGGFNVPSGNVELQSGNLLVSDNVGIGTTNPTRQLEVNGDIKATDGHIWTDYLTVSEDMQAESLYAGEISANRYCMGSSCIIGWPGIVTKVYASESHNGNFGGYEAMNRWIQTHGCAGYHVCTQNELLNIALAGKSNLISTGISHPAWYADFTTSECNGWKSSSNSVTGPALEFEYGFGSSGDEIIPVRQSCHFERAVLCCK